MIEDRPTEAETGHDASALDEPTLYRTHDRSGLGPLLEGLPAQARRAWDLGQWCDLPELPNRPSRVLLLGMGGSAIGADVVATVAAGLTSVPVQVVRDYTPPVTNPDTLVIACSFSGDTEETLAAFEAAGTDGPRLALTTGGRLAAIADERGLTAVRYEWAGPPRTALGYGVFTLLGVLARLSVLDLDAGDVERTLAGLEASSEAWGAGTPSDTNEAKRLAAALAGRAPVIIGTGFLDAAARRWSGEIAENAKQWAFPVALPEFDHNHIEGLLAPRTATEHLAAVLLSTPIAHPRNRARVDDTADALREAGIPAHIVTVEGSTPLEAIVQGCLLGSWTSYYLAMLNGVDPLPMPAIERLKARMAEQR